ncbi:MAG TPA: sigma-70 family RNA polymerase sigma factor [Verrucomicrobiae bacterium]|nr:sigma-70 family RNA polymerase sigma factor [Verrucomicrobiae bacterium]
MTNGGLANSLAPDSASGPRPPSLILLRELQLRLDGLYDASPAAGWNLSRGQFLGAVENSVAKCFADCLATPDSLLAYLETLHIDDLVLAAACRHGSEAAWDHFVANYRGYLRAAAAAITKGSRAGADPQELADSLFAELFGLVDGKRGESSLFRYFHGRSSLKTWLRAILAQRHVDCLRQSRRWESIEKIEKEDGENGKVLHTQKPSSVPALDPHRDRYLQCFVLALNDSLASFDAADRRLLELYYARDKTLAEIGRLLGEHESSASRHLDRARRELRALVENCLRSGLLTGDAQPKFAPLSDAEIILCFQYAAEDAPIDFRNIFPDQTPSRAENPRKGSP